MSVVVSGLAVTAVKGTRLRPVSEIHLERHGAEGDRRFYVIDERDRMVNGKHLGDLQTVVADYQPLDRRLSLTLPDGRVVEDRVAHGPAVQTGFYSRPRAATLVEGPFSRALSELCGQPLRVVEADGDSGALDRGRGGAASLISKASLARLASAAGVQQVDARRFRMLIEVDGVGAHAEDAWVGSRRRVGRALIDWGGHVGRCLITSRDPESGRIDLPTLDVLRGYRDGSEATEPLPFGIYGSVIKPGAVRVGDLVESA